MAVVSNIEQILEDFYTILLTLNPASPDSFDQLEAFFSDNCKVYPVSMREHLTPFMGPVAAVEGSKTSQRGMQLVERRILSQMIDHEKRKIMCEMQNHLVVSGKDLDPFHETVVVQFDAEGKILEWKRYCCGSPVAALTQSVTGEGPYEDVSIVITP